MKAQARHQVALDITPERRDCLLVGGWEVQTSHFSGDIAGVWKQPYYQQTEMKVWAPYLAFYDPLEILEYLIIAQGRVEVGLLLC